MRFLESSGLSHIGIPDTKGKINCWTSCTLHLRKKYSTHWIQGRHFASTLQLTSVRRAQTKESYLTDLGSLNINVCISCSVMFDSLWPHGIYIARQDPMTMKISRQEYWSGLPFPSPGDLPDPGIKPRFLALHLDPLLSEPPGKSFRSACLSVADNRLWGFHNCMNQFL